MADASAADGEAGAPVQPEPSTTHRLIREIQDGVGEAFNPLFRRMTPRLLAYISDRMSPSLRGVTSAADLLQDSYLRAFERFESFEDRGPGSFAAWILTICRHQVVDAYRHHFQTEKRSADELVSLEALGVEGESGHVPAADGPGVSTVVHRADLVRTVFEVLDDLPADQRDAVLLCHFHGMSAAEAGERLSRTANAVRLLLVRGLRAVRQLVAERVEGAGPAGLPPAR